MSCKTAQCWILYSSCQVATLVQDLGELEDYRVCRVRLFDVFLLDMFHHTANYETLVLLERRATTPVRHRFGHKAVDSTPSCLSG
ncbi:hypothetical protein [Sodalis sp.]|uniref:hypothetical protein n=1 Tax=Sodalis sp. (in: enterobacteria) TaxID=1898979 RepID=UPI003873C729